VLLVRSRIVSYRFEFEYLESSRVSGDASSWIRAAWLGAFVGWLRRPWTDAVE
jgi:hypothetical protein